MQRDACAGEPRARRELHEGEQVPVVRVYAPVAHEAHQVERLARLLRPGAGVRERRYLEEITAADALADAHEVLPDDAAGTEVEMADLAVAHLSLREAHGEAAR